MKTVMKNSAKGIILHNGCVLMLKKQYDDGQVIYTLPGGGQAPGESLEEALVREVYEETAARVDPGALIGVYEHQRRSSSKQDEYRHKVEFAFMCYLQGDYIPQMGPTPDKRQVAVEWVAINQLYQLELSPKRLYELFPLPEMSIGNLYRHVINDMKLE